MWSWCSLYILLMQCIYLIISLPNSDWAQAMIWMLIVSNFSKQNMKSWEKQERQNPTPVWHLIHDIVDFGYCYKMQSKIKLPIFVLPIPSLLSEQWWFPVQMWESLPLVMWPVSNVRPLWRHHQWLLWLHQCRSSRWTLLSACWSAESVLSLYFV